VSTRSILFEQRPTHQVRRGVLRLCDYVLVMMADCLFSIPPFFLVPKGGWESSDVKLENAALREALEEGLTLCPSYRLLIS